MKLLLVTGSFPPMPCGVGDYTYRLAKALAADTRFKVAVLTGEAARGVPGPDAVEILPVVKSWNLAGMSSVIRAIRAWKPDIVHIQYPTQGYGSGWLPDIVPAIAALLGAKVVQTWHEWFGRRSPPVLLLRSLFPSGLVVVRPAYREKLHPLLRWALWNKRFAFIPNASPMSRIEVTGPQRHDLRARYLRGQGRLIVFFGFVYPPKGVERLFQIGDPGSDAIVIAGETSGDRDYFRSIERLASTPPWQGKTTITGFLPVDDAARLIAVADAVILPFRDGGGEWNTSLHAAVAQGTFVITTSRDRNGYDAGQNVYYAALDDTAEMRMALDARAGTRRERGADTMDDEWRVIADRHHQLYQALVS